MTKFRDKWLLLLLLILTFWISFIIRTLSWIHIFGNQGAFPGRVATGFQFFAI
ncbi:MAG: spermidine/putrescine transport system permease protein [Granulosicoccus sp.]|jgi:spermidine/putrescine transport system permease protein